MVGRVLDALGAPAGKDDDRTRDQRYHDALAEAMRRLVAADLLPERAGQPVKAWVHISLADLLLLDGDSALQEQWTAQVRARWAACRAFASETGSEGGAWLDGRRRRGGRVRRRDGPAGDRRRQHRRAGGPGPAVRGTGPAPPRWRGRGRRARTPRLRAPRPAAPDTTAAWAALEQAVIGKAVDLLSGPGGLAGSCAAGSSASAWAGRACRWISGTPSRSRPGSATR